MNQTLGEIAYNAYCENRKWKSVKGEPLPSFRAQKMELQAAWEQAAEAVSNKIKEKIKEGQFPVD
jgi:hypothetical protein